MKQREGEPLTLFVPWPTYPLITPGGKVSLAKTAGRPIKWLSANEVNNLNRRVYRDMAAAWRDLAAMVSVTHPRWDGEYPVMLDFLLQKRTAQNMDPFAVLEGAKHVIDGFVQAGLFPDDNDNYVRGGTALARKGSPLGLYVRVTEWVS